LRLLRLASQAGCRQLAVAPCCYNRIPGPFYQPLSQTAGRSLLALSLDDLRLPLSETVTASQRVRRQRDQSMARRLGFDLLQRELRGIDQYLSVPSLPVAWLERPYADYCRELAALKGLPEPAARDWQALEAAGWKRLAMVRNLELVRALFRRPLELWLLLDRCLYLVEQGYSVRLGEFCPTFLSPRNLLILAERS
ncbi:methyltransferase, partial [Pseudomonas aeruginosa]|nr:methyltransferase [Pseudomonas aeruginosa]